MDASKNHPHQQSATETTNWAPAFSVAGVIFNYALIIVFLLLAWHKGWLADLWQWCEEYPVYASAIGTALAGWLGQVVNHKVKTTGRVNTPFKHISSFFKFTINKNTCPMLLLAHKIQHSSSLNV